MTKSSKRSGILSRLTATSFVVVNFFIVVWGLALIFVAWQNIDSHHFSVEFAFSTVGLFILVCGYFYFNFHMAKRIKKEGLASKYELSNGQKIVFYFLVLLFLVSTIVPMDQNNPIKQLLDFVPFVIGVFVLIALFGWRKNGQMKPIQFNKYSLVMALYLMALIIAFLAQHKFFKN